jgi:hypothetical protein
LAQGTLQCNDKTAALIASYLVQGALSLQPWPIHPYDVAFNPNIL